MPVLWFAQTQLLTEEALVRAQLSHYHDPVTRTYGLLQDD